MRFTNLTRQIGIGANSYLVELGGKRIVLDAGLHPKEEGESATPDFSLLRDHLVDAVFLSHAHQDHVGSLPLLTQRCVDVPVFMTGPTSNVADAMLHNSVNVMRRKAEDSPLAGAPLFTHRGADLCAASWKTVPLRTRLDLHGNRLGPQEKTEEVSFEFFDAGHILGSVGVLLREGDRRIFYTGDVNFHDQTLLPGAEFPEEPLDVLIMETTRGNSPAPEGFTRKDEEARFAQALNAAYERGGCILIPVFAIGKTQEILALLFKLYRSGQIRLRPVYIGGLSTKMTGIYDQYRKSTPRQFPGLELLDAIAPFTLTGKNIDNAHAGKSHIYALSSGMMTEKTLSNSFARRVIDNPESSIFLVGYTDPDSPAGKLRAAGQGGCVRLDSAFPEQTVLSRIEEFNFSAHSDRESLRQFAIARNPKKILLVHGDPEAVSWFQQTLQMDLPDAEIIIPEPGLEYEI